MLILIVCSIMVDIKGGKLTFAQRIELGEIFGNGDMSEVEKFERAIKCIYGKKIKPNQYGQYVGKFRAIVEGLQYWCEVEARMLHSEPTTDERAAGIEEYSKNIGIFGTVKAIAKTFGQDPDDVLQWEYGKVFSILYTDLEDYKYQRRLNKVIERKYKFK